MMKLILTILAAVAALAVFVPPALAGESVLGPALAEAAVNMVFPFVAVVVAGFVVVVLRKIADKLNIEITEQHEHQLRQLAFRGITLAEERAADWMKNRSMTMPGPEKLNTAVAYVLTKMPKITREEAETLVESELGQLVGPGATGFKVP